MERKAPLAITAAFVAALGLGATGFAAPALAGEATQESPGSAAGGIFTALAEAAGAGGTSAKSAPSELSDDPMSFQFAVEGVAVQLPCTVADLQEPLDLSLLADDAGTVLDSGYETVVTLYFGDPAKDVRVSMSVYNVSGAELPIEACPLSSIIFSTSSFPGVKVEVPGGLERGSSTLEEALAAWGEPSESYEVNGSNRFMASYYDDPENPYQLINLWFENGVLSEIDLEFGYVA